MLIKMMTQLKSDLGKMKTYLHTNCKSASASKELLVVVKEVESQVNEIDDHIILGEYQSAFEKIAYEMPRKKDYYIRRNYDYGEFWPAALDAFRDGKIKDVVEMARSLRRWPGKEDAPMGNGSLKEIDTKADNPDAKKKKMINRASEESLLHLDAYCGKPENIAYWSQMQGEDEEHSEAVEDFLNYIKELKC